MLHEEWAAWAESREAARGAARLLADVVADVDRPSAIADLAQGGTDADDNENDTSDGEKPGFT